MVDEFKDVGKYFDEGEYVSLPITIPNTDWTMEGWFIWLSGDGPLMEAEDEDGDWDIARDTDGRCSYRIGNETRVTDLLTGDMRDSWIHLVLAKESAIATLYFNGEPADRWDRAPAEGRLSTCAAMRGAVGFAADIAIYDRALDAETVGQHWSLGKSRV